jgi:hypothetical protein
VTLVTCAIAGEVTAAVATSAVAAKIELIFIKFFCFSTKRQLLRNPTRDLRTYL